MSDYVLVPAALAAAVHEADVEQMTVAEARDLLARIAEWDVPAAPAAVEDVA